MAVIYLLDTNAWIAYLRQTNQNVVQRVRQSRTADIGLCSIVVAELLYGAYHSAPAFRLHNLGLLAALRAQFASLPFDDVAADHHGKVRADLAAKGMPIGPNDLMIAAIVLAHSLILVTHNTAEFQRVAGLTVEDWQI